MKFRNAAFIDEYVLKYLLKIVSLLSPGPNPLDGRINPRNILIIKFWGIGSILQATPLCQALREAYPGAEIDLITFSGNKTIADSLDIFRKVSVIEYPAGPLSLSRQTLEVVLSHRKKYDLVLDLEFFAMYSALVTRFISGEHSLGFESFYHSRNRCYSRTVVFDHSSHVRVIFLKFMDALSQGPYGERALSAPAVPETVRASAVEKFPSLANGSFKVGVNINSSELSLNRCWPADYYRKLIGLIRDVNPSVEIYLVGGNSDRADVESFYRSLNDREGVFVTAGRLDILEFTHALGKMDLFITNDSGPLHLSEAVGTPVVGFFGPETHNLYGPLSKESLVFYRNLYCSPCLNTYNHKRSRCKDNQCLKLITPEEVFGRLTEAFPAICDGRRVAGDR